MTEQLSMVPGEHPDRLVERAIRLHSPISSWCLFSGGNDSTVLAHRCRDHFGGLAFIDTGTAVPGVVEFCEEFAAWLGKPLRILKAGDAYRVMVLGDDRWWERSEPGVSVEGMAERNKAAFGQWAGVVKRGPHKGLDLGQMPYGFPTGASHGRAYNRLKERQIDALVRREKVGHPRSARVLLLTGIRRVESAKRSKHSPLTRSGAAAYVNPLIDWTDADMRRYRVEHDIPESDAAALLHRSAECNCGAHANARDESRTLVALYPDWWNEIIAPIEAEAERLGIRWSRYGGYDLDGNRATDESDEEAGLLCSDCPSRLFHPDQAAA